MNNERTMHSFRRDDWHTNEGALRCMLHVVSGVALQAMRGEALSDGQRADLEQMLGEQHLWPQTLSVIRKLAHRE